MASGSWGFLGINLSQAWSSLREGIVNITFVSNFFPKQQEEERVEKAPSPASSDSGSKFDSPRNSDLGDFARGGAWPENAAGPEYASRRLDPKRPDSVPQLDLSRINQQEGHDQSPLPRVLEVKVPPFEYGDHKVGNRMPVVLVARSVDDLEKQIGWEKFLEGDDTAMEKLKQKFQNLFDEKDSAKIANELEKIKPGFRESNRAHPKKFNQTSIDSAFALLGEIANNPDAKIIKSPQIIEIADNIIEYYKPIRIKELTEDWYEKNVEKIYEIKSKQLLDEDEPSQPIVENKKFSRLGPSPMEVQASMKDQWSSGPDPDEDEPSREVGEVKAKEVKRMPSTVSSKWLKGLISSSANSFLKGVETPKISYTDFQSKIAQERSREQIIGSQERQEQLKESLNHHFASYNPFSVHNEILRMKKNFPIPVDNGIKDEEMTTKINEAFEKMNRLIVQKKPVDNFSIEEMQIIEFSLKKTQELSGRAIRGVGLSI